MNDLIHVAVAVIRNNNGEVFITKRPDHVHQGGLWEFPGGKVEDNETVQDALIREIHEENGIEIQDSVPLIKIPYQYPDKQVLLDVWEVLSYTGVPHGKEGQSCDWVAIHDLTDVSFPAANRAIVKAVQLPSTFLVTPEPGVDRKSFLRILKHCIASGQQWLQLRSKKISSEDYYEMAKQVCEISSEFDANVMLNTDIDSIHTLNAAGLHVTSKELMKFSQRPVGLDKWFSASCHNQTEIEHANSIDVDFIFVGSVKKTTSHADRQPIGWEEFSRLTNCACMPAYAIGGITTDDIKQCREMGGQGIAAISALWKNAT